MNSAPFKKQEITEVATAEVGHAKNAATFKKLIEYCTTLAKDYNPSNCRLKIEQMEKLYKTAQERLGEVNSQKTILNHRTNNRKAAFEGLKPFSTKIINAFAASGVKKSALDEAKIINKKLQGIKSFDPTKPEHSYTSEQSYTKKIDHFRALFMLLESNPIYSPNEEHLKVASLKSKLNDLEESNFQFLESYTLFMEALYHRNQVLYNSESGLVQTAKEVKQYIKSVYGTGSSQYKQMRSFQFKIRTGACGNKV